MFEHFRFVYLSSFCYFFIWNPNEQCLTYEENFSWKTKASSKVKAFVGMVVLNKINTNHL